MGRPKIEIDTEVLMDLAERGLSSYEIAEEMDVSARTIQNRIAEIQNKQGILLKYRALQSLQLTELQVKILEQITPEKIEEAPLRDLVLAYKILKDKEFNIEGKPTEIKGLVGWLVQLEKEEAALREKEDYEDVDFQEVKSVYDDGYIPDL